MQAFKLAKKHQNYTVSKCMECITKYEHKKQKQTQDAESKQSNETVEMEEYHDITTLRQSSRQNKQENKKQDRRPEMKRNVERVTIQKQKMSPERNQPQFQNTNAANQRSQIHTLQNVTPNMANMHHVQNQPYRHPVNPMRHQTWEDNVVIVLPHQGYQQGRIPTIQTPRIYPVIMPENRVSPWRQST